ncbi:MAG: hypothetical protein LUC94_06760 [Clostridiales bacterium]|nr:hypothetical protein [Clostridiales bacterium]
MGRKKFNITGLCIPDRHYMVDVSEKINQIIENYNEDGRVKISNRIFESYIYEYLISVNRTRQFVTARYADKQQYIENGKLNMKKEA